MCLEAKKTDNPLTPQQGRLKLSPNTEGMWESIDENGVKSAIGGFGITWISAVLYQAAGIVNPAQTIDLSAHGNGQAAVVQVRAFDNNNATQTVTVAFEGNNVLTFPPDPNYDGIRYQAIVKLENNSFDFTVSSPAGEDAYCGLYLIALID